MHFRGAALAFSTVLTVLKAGAIAGIVTFCVSDYMANAALPEDFVLPQIKLSPYEIFANQVPLFDVDFFNPMEDITVQSSQRDKLQENGVKPDDLEEKLKSYGISKTKDDIDKNKTFVKNEEMSDMYSKDQYQSNATANGEEYKIIIHISTNGVSETGRTYDIYKVEKESSSIHSSTAYNLRTTISTWYIVLRNLALVALLSVLVYVGIRIIISSTAGDKAKYKQWLVDWIVAVCLLFTMHYIMSFSNILVGKLISIVDATDVVENVDDYKVSGTLSSDGVSVSKAPQVFNISDKKKVKKAYKILVEDNEDDPEQFKGLFVIEGGSPTELNWPTSNFIEQARMLLQYQDSDDAVTNYAYASIGYKIIYIVLVLYTFIFAFTYLKRVVYMAFLTLIAPLVALTYPIDKMNDGQAQAFNKWFKEYIFNLLIQPLHLILYMVLVGSAFDFASKNLFYVVIALGFMTQGEKLLRQFFGFEKAHTPGFLGGPAGAAIMMGGVNKLLGKPPLGGKPPKEIGGSGSSSESIDSGKINYKNDLDTSSIYGLKESSSDSEAGATSSVNKKTGNNGVLNGNANTNTGTNANAGVTSGRGKFDPKLLNKKALKRMNNNGTKIRNVSAGPNVPFKVKKINGVKRGVSNMLANQGQRIRLRSQNKQPLRSLARGVAGVAGAATAMTAAGLVGITSGDPSKAAQYMTGAAIGGYKFADGFGDKAADIVDDVKSDVDAYQQAADPREYKKKQIEKNFKEAENNIKLQNELAERLGGREEAKEAMEQVGKDCIGYGLSDARDIATVSELVNNGYEQDNALKYVKAAKDYGKNTSELGHKDREDFVKTIGDRVRKQMPANAKEEDVQNTIDGVIKEFDNTSKILFKK